MFSNLSTQTWTEQRVLNNYLPCVPSYTNNVDQTLVNTIILNAQEKFKSLQIPIDTIQHQNISQDKVPQQMPDKSKTLNLNTPVLTKLVIENIVSTLASPFDNDGMQIQLMHMRGLAQEQEYSIQRAMAEGERSKFTRKACDFTHVERKYHKMCRSYYNEELALQAQMMNRLESAKKQSCYQSSSNFNTRDMPTPTNLTLKLLKTDQHSSHESIGFKTSGAASLTTGMEFCTLRQQQKNQQQYQDQHKEDQQYPSLLRQQSNTIESNQEKDFLPHPKNFVFNAISESSNMVSNIFQKENNVELRLLGGQLEKQDSKSINYLQPLSLNRKNLSNNTMSKKSSSNSSDDKENENSKSMIPIIGVTPKISKNFNQPLSQKSSSRKSATSIINPIHNNNRIQNQTFTSQVSQQFQGQQLIQSVQTINSRFQNSQNSGSLNENYLNIIPCQTLINQEMSENGQNNQTQNYHGPQTQFEGIGTVICQDHDSEHPRIHQYENQQQQLISYDVYNNCFADRQMVCSSSMENNENNLTAIYGNSSGQGRTNDDQYFRHYMYDQVTPTFQLPSSQHLPLADDQSKINNAKSFQNQHQFIHYPANFQIRNTSQYPESDDDIMNNYLQ